MINVLIKCTHMLVYQLCTQKKNGNLHVPIHSSLLEEMWKNFGHSNLAAITSPVALIALVI